MADAQVLYAEKATDTSASTTTWVDCTTIAAASFTASKKYAVLAFAYLKAAGASTLPRVRLVHGSTPTEFTDALVVSEHGGASARVCYGWFHVFDQPSTTEDIKIQVSDSGTDTAIVELAQVMALKLSDDFTENTDWYYNEVTTDDAYATTTQDGASVTVAADGADRWLLIGNLSTDVANATQTYENYLTANGTDVRRCFTIDGEDTAAFHNWLLMRSTVLGSGNIVVKTRYLASGTANTLLSSRVFALNLSKFAQLVQDEAGDAHVPPQPSFTSGDPCSVGITPAATGNFVILATTVLDCNTASNQQDHRIQVNNGGGLASDPSFGDDVPNVSYGNNAAEEYPVSLIKVRSLSSGASRTVNYDWKRRAANTTDIDFPELIVFSVALAEAGAAYTHAAETDTAQGSGVRHGITRADETDSARGIAARLSYGVAIETDSARGIAARLGYGLTSEADTSRGIAARLGYGLTSELDSALAFTLGGLVIEYGPAIETDSAQGIAARLGYGLGTEADTARAIAARLGYGAALEADTAGAFILTGPEVIAYTAALELDTAGAFLIVPLFGPHIITHRGDEPAGAPTGLLIVSHAGDEMAGAPAGAAHVVSHEGDEPAAAAASLIIVSHEGDEPAGAPSGPIHVVGRKGA